ncbi:MAG: tripartite tricarboxylate transporter substrate binding protein [Acetobacterales bacterium]
MFKRTITGLAIAALAAAGCVTSASAAYPERPITVLIGFPPGGNVDIAARQAQPFMEKYLGGSIAVVNKPGAAGALAYTEAANAKPDGYTLVMLSLPGVFTVLFGGEPRYSVDSFDYIGLLTDEPYSIFVNANSRFKTLKDLIDASKADPGSVTIAGAGTGSAPHIGALAFEKAAGIKLTWVPMQGAANMRTGVLGGHVDGGLTSVSVSVPLHTEGQARTLGLMGAERWSEAPNIPTMAEQGAAVEWSASRGFGAPKGTPEDILVKLEDAVRKTYNDPEFQRLAKRDKMILRHLDRAGFKKFAESQYNLLDSMWKEDPWR